MLTFLDQTARQATSATGDCSPLPGERLHHLFERACDRLPDNTAIVCGKDTLTYRELDNRANQLARHLLTTGVRPADRVGILLRRSVDTYVSLLAILKVGAAFVPLDTAFPDERIGYIARDAELAALVTTLEADRSLPGLTCHRILVDRDREQISTQPVARLRASELSLRKQDNLCYIIYTSGSTGQPKGVAIEHPSICNFVQVAAEIYDIRRSDRVYQGMTIAFDFSIEEIWPALIRGATVVAGPDDERRLGDDLAEFLDKHAITVFCCVPTLLATMEKDVKSLRTLLVGGEPCPGHLVNRWARKGRRMLNTYGPTETTVTATWGELHPGKPVTIGRPLPTYTVHLLDDQARPVPDGEPGEICIGGIGLARGYVNREEQTAKAFIPDPFQAPDNPSGRLYRTGDLGRRLENGEIEFLGRIDTQVKLKGYRIELTEIESVILEAPEVRKVVVAPCRMHENLDELVAYCELRAGYTDLDQELLQARLQRHLPGYMIPGWLEILDRIPTLANGKVDRKTLPKPTGRRLSTGSAEYEPPADLLEGLLSREVARLLNLNQVSVTADFFLDLGGHSLLVAQLISRLRREPGMEFLALADLYRHPTIRGLATYIRKKRKTGTAVTEAKVGNLQKANPGKIPLCAALQLLATWLTAALYATPGLVIFRQMLTDINWSRPDYFQVASLAALGILLALLLSLSVPVILKWSLLGRVRPGRHRLWGWLYFRLWLVDKTLAVAPLFLLSGTPFLSAYYRILGARIGRNVILASPLLHLPDLITIGDRSSVNSGTHIFARHVEEGFLILAPVRIGCDCCIGSNAVLMPGSTLEDQARLGDQALLPSQTTVPTGAWWSGSPAGPVQRKSRPTPTVDRASGHGLQTPLFLAGILGLVMIPSLATVPVLVCTRICYRLLGDFWPLPAALIAGPLFVCSLCGLIVFLKKLILPQIEPGRYRIDSLLYTRKWFVDRLMELSLMLTNSLYATLYLAPFLRRLGARIGRMAEVSTISHITPELLTIGDESFLADIAHVGPMRLEGGHFFLEPVRISRRAFVGNAAFVPAGTTTGTDSLIGVLSLPPDGEVAPETTWLGSPPICFPERETSQSFPEHLTFSPPRKLIRRRLAHEYFRVTLPPSLSFLGLSALFILASTLLSNMSLGLVALVMGGAVPLTGLVLCLTVAGIKSTLIGRYRPLVRPMWSSFVWRSELVTGLYESLAVPWLLAWFTGTPLLPPLLRMFGARIGSRCCLETTFLTEFDLVEVGDDCCIGPNCSLQTHLFEDRVMKMSRLRIGNRCSVGPRSVVLYDAVLEDGVVLDGLTLVMKGETLPTNSRWQGIPATPRSRREVDHWAEAA